ncbi:MAG TPA: DNA translocase FtsK [Acidimicrobiales bacterium]|nr:DNA translocase FtsK [Acidimicrobiales bacterium]
MALVVGGLFVVLAEADALGPFGRAIARALADALGVGRFALAVFLLGLGAALVWRAGELDRARLGWGLALGLVTVSGLADLAAGRPGIHATASALADGGGWLGVLVGGGLSRGVGIAGAVVVLVALAVVAVIVATGVGLGTLARGAVTTLRLAGSGLARWWSSAWRVEEPERVARARSGRVAGTAFDEDAVDEGYDDYDEVAPAAGAFDYADDEPSPGDALDGEDRASFEAQAPATRPDPARASTPAPPVHAGEWERPALSLLARTRDQRHDRSAAEAAGHELVEALGAHGVETSLVGFTVGPTVTRFELELGPGVKVSRVTSLNRDIAYAMASPDVRILAPIPGRSAIGVEVPNRQRTLVALGDLLASEEALAATHPLDVPVGRDISGRTVVVNLGEMPHVLISGATGAGKSSAINSLITSLVVRATPDQLRLLLIDPKRVEMGQYNDLPHLLAPVVVDPKKAAGALQWAVREMERRYDLLAEVGARDITGYQQMLARGELGGGPRVADEVADAIESATGVEVDRTVAPEPESLPYVVVVVDELNDLMMVAARDVEDSVVRIAQMARAVGIHLVLATQRPSVDVITGVIKANIPSRMAFAVSSIADSRVILDQAGAEKLIGKGDMLLVTASSNVARRLQSPWVSEDEVRRVVEAWRRQGGRTETVVALEAPAGRGSAGGAGGDDDDEVLRQARELVIRTQSGSTSMLQRKLRVGFARAGRLMDQLEQEGVVAPGEGSKSRKVLVTLDEYEQSPS